MLTVLVVCAVLAGARAGELNINPNNLPPCAPVPVIFRYNNITCRPQAVCGDIIDSPRNWYGEGGRQPCFEHRVIHNCMCPGQNGGAPTMCPLENEDHSLYSAAFHKQITCEPKCEFPFCNNLLTRGRNDPDVAMVSGDLNFNNRTYYQINCRCARHHTPRGERNRAVFAFTNRYNPMTGLDEMVYKCRNTGTERLRSDPCPRPYRPNPLY